MRTTLAIDDRVLAAAKSRAAAEGVTLGQFVEQAVRQSLLPVAEHSAPPAPLPVSSKTGGFVPGIDPMSNRSLYDALDQAGDRR